MTDATKVSNSVRSPDNHCMNLKLKSCRNMKEISTDIFNTENVKFEKKFQQLSENFLSVKF